jgi:hypothetical protein
MLVAASMKERLRGLLEQVLLTRLLYDQLSLAEKGALSDDISFYRRYEWDTRSP